MYMTITLPDTQTSRRVLLFNWTKVPRLQPNVDKLQRDWDLYMQPFDVRKYRPGTIIYEVSAF